MPCNPNLPEQRQEISRVRQIVCTSCNSFYSLPLFKLSIAMTVSSSSVVKSSTARLVIAHTFRVADLASLPLSSKFRSLGEIESAIFGASDSKPLV